MFDRIRTPKPPYVESWTYKRTDRDIFFIAGAPTIQWIFVYEDKATGGKRNICSPMFALKRDENGWRKGRRL